MSAVQTEVWCWVWADRSATTSTSEPRRAAGGCSAQQMSTLCLQELEIKQVLCPISALMPSRYLLPTVAPAGEAEG